MVVKKKKEDLRSDPEDAKKKMERTGRRFTGHTGEESRRTVLPKPTMNNTSQLYRA